MIDQKATRPNHKDSLNHIGKHNNVMLKVATIFLLI